MKFDKDNEKTSWWIRFPNFASGIYASLPISYTYFTCHMTLLIYSLKLKESSFFYLVPTPSMVLNRVHLSHVPHALFSSHSSLRLNVTQLPTPQRAYP